MVITRLSLVIGIAVLLVMSSITSPQKNLLNEMSNETLVECRGRIHAKIGQGLGTYGKKAAKFRIRKCCVHWLQESLVARELTYRNFRLRMYLTSKITVFITNPHDFLSHKRLVDLKAEKHEQRPSKNEQRWGWRDKKTGMTQWGRLPMLPSWSSSMILPSGKLTNNELERSTMNFIWENSRNKWIYKW